MALILSEAVVSQDGVYIRVPLVIPIVLVLCELEYLALIAFPVLEFLQGQVSFGGL